MDDVLAALDRNVPTCVGVYRIQESKKNAGDECPHVRGGVPVVIDYTDPLIEMSPRAWGCTGKVERILDKTGNVPTCVGVYRRNGTERNAPRKCPHVRGGVPRGLEPRRSILLMSPRAWGCTAP